MKKTVSSILLLGLLLGCHNGYVALWKAGNPTPLTLYPYPVSLLPPADQIALAEGIPIKDFRELSQRLEDYLS